MKIGFLIALTYCLNLPIFCQNIPATELRYDKNQAISAAARYPVQRRQINNGVPPGIKNFEGLHVNPDYIKQYVNQQPANTQFKASGTNHNFIQKPGNTLCVDTSFSRLLGVYNGWLYIESVTQTSDGGVLVPAVMYDTTRSAPWWRSFALLIKLNGDGQVSWLKQFEDLTPGNFSNYSMHRAFELPNHDIVCTGSLNNSGSSSVYETMVYRLTATGNMIWKNNLQSTIGTFNSPPGTYTYYVEGVTDGLNGDLILSGTSSANTGDGKIESVIRLNNLGQLVWDANYGNHGSNGAYYLGAEGTSVLVQNGQVVLVGLSHGSSSSSSPASSPAINFLTLDYNNGNLLTKRFFRPNYSDPAAQFLKGFTYFTNKFTRLTNGHFLYYGKLFSDFIPSPPIIDHFGVIEFDAAFNLVNAYTISSGLATNYSNDLLQFDPSGRGLISVLQYISGFEANVFFGAFNGQQFQNQRKAHYTNTGMPGNNGFAFLNDNGYAYIQSYFINQPGTKSYFEFRKMHNSDTTSQCLGKDTVLLNFLPLQFVEDPGYFWLDPNEPNKFITLPQSISQTDTTSTSSLNPCQQINYCDTIKIHGNPAICGSSIPVIFTAYKNAVCGASVQWDIDPAAIDSVKILSDTSVKIWFKNINWVGKLYAILPGGACNASAADSLTLNVIGLQQQLNLGPDTVLCSQNTMILHAGNTFFSYLWQNGSTDSTFTVVQPGTYYVTVNDLCGNTLSDTIHIAPAVFPFSVGVDTILCNHDTLHLTATAGFINYHWYYNYNINTTVGQMVKVYPGVDTFYFATADKWPGCSVRDTIHINVRSSPLIFLGPDTSLCTGQSLNLDAGPGFVSYLWNTGSLNRLLTVNQAGTYFVRATASNGCASADTLKILNVSPLPVFSLGVDTTICSGKVYHYAFNLPNATYLWQDGNTSNQYTINQAGQYSLSVTQAGCTARDAVLITYKQGPAVFLGNDTSLCVGNTVLLNASYPNGTYLWQDGSILSQYLVSLPGNYNVVVGFNGCTASDTITVKYISKPFFDLGRDTTICAGQTLLLRPALNTPVSYNWQDNSHSSSFTVTQPGLYSLKTFNSCGSFSDQIVVTAGLCRLLLPNSFTPNGDGINDIFKVKYPFPVKEFQFSIYNRYGEKIFETADMQKGWDGTYGSVKQETGSYIWVIRIVELNGVVESNTGTITILR